MSKKTTENDAHLVSSSGRPQPEVKVTPTLGRVVTFHYKEGQDRTATIVSINEDSTVDLHVHMLVVDQRDILVHAQAVGEGAGLGCWSWPPRV